MNRVFKYEIVDHGFDGASYFPGCGVAFTDFDEVFTGCGSTAAEAMEDAIAQSFESDCAWPAEMTGEITEDWLNSEWAKQESDVDTSDDFNEWYYYVSIRVKFAKDTAREEVG